MNMVTNSILPLYIGISGHRDIPLDEENLTRFTTSIQGILNWYRRACPYTEVRLMSLLASGADSVAAQAALAIGVPVTGILPLPRDEYANDFQPGIERGTFDHLCSLCAELHELPLPAGSAEDIRQHGPVRDQAYLAGGIFLANHCHALIALWNGCDSGLVGGTAHVARLQLDGTSAERSLDVPTSGPVHWIRCPRTQHTEQLESGNPLVPDIPCLPAVSEDPEDLESWCTATLYPSAWRAGAGDGGDKVAINKARDFYASVQASINRFNRDARANTRLSESLAKDHPQDPLFLQAVDRLYVHADACSLRFQGKADSLLTRLGLIGLACFCSMVVFDELINFVFTLFVFFGLLLAAYVIHRLGVRNEYDGRYFDYRSLAELCRVTYHLGLAGVEFDPGGLIPGRYRSSLSWIAYAARVAAIPLVLAPVRGDNTEAAHARWVVDQCAWYIRKLPLKQKALARRRMFRLGFFGAAVLTASGFLVGKLYGVMNGTDLSPWWDLRFFKSGLVSSWIQALFDIFISIGAVFALIMEIKAYEDEIELYQRASASFKRAMERFMDCGSQEARRSVLLALGRMAVGEHAEWNALHRARPLELPMG